MMNTFLIGILAGTIFLSAPVAALAETQTVTQPSQTQPTVSQTQTSPFELKNPLSFTNICGFFKAIFNAALMIGIPVATLFIVWAGFLFVVARGKPEALTKAKANALYVAIGVAVFLGAWFLAQIIAATIQALGGPSIASC